jgi:hypothetical protein
VPEEPTHAGPTLRLVRSEVDPSGETDAVHTAGARSAEPTTRRRAHDPGEEPTSGGPTLRLAKGDVDPSEETDAVHTAAARAGEPTALRPIRATKARSPVEDDDTGALLAETGVRPRPLGRDEALGDPTHTAWVPGPTAKEAKEDQTAWVPGPKRAEEPRADRDDGESLTLTFARPAATSGPSGWIVKHGTRAWPVPTDKPLTIGRSRSSDVRLDDPHVSGDHLELRLDGRALIVREKIAKNRTWLDGEEIVGDVRIEPTRRTWTLKLAEVEVLLSWAAPLPGSRR